MIKKTTGIIFLVCLLTVAVFADDSSDYVETNIGITKEYWDNDTIITSFNITFGEYFTDLESIVLYCDPDKDGNYNKTDDNNINLNWERIDEDSFEDNWRVYKVGNDYFKKIKIEKVYGGGEISNINYSDILSSIGDSIYNLSTITISSLDLSTKFGKCQGDLEGCNKFNEEYKGSANQYKGLFENTSAVQQTTELELSTCRNTLSTKSSEIGTCKTDLETSNNSKTTIGFVWWLIGAVVGFFIGKRKEVAPPEFEQFSETGP